MKVFVTGATGFVGREIIQHLHSAGYTIHILARDPESEPVQELVSRYSVAVHPGNVLDADSLTAALSGMHAVIHLVGIISEFRKNTFESVHTLGTQNVVGAAQSAGVGRFVHMSALGTRPESVSRYHQTKWEAEEVVRQSDIDYTIFRPSLIYGSDDQFVNLFARMIRFSPIVPILAPDSSHFQPVSIETVAVAFARGVAEPRSIGQTYDLCGPEALTLAQIVDEICRVMRRRRLKVRVPNFLSRMQATFLEFIFPRLFRRASPLNRDQLIMLHEDNVGNPQPANDLLHLTPIRFREGIAKYLEKDS